MKQKKKECVFALYVSLMGNRKIITGLILTVKIRARFFVGIMIGLMKGMVVLSSIFSFKFPLRFVIFYVPQNEKPVLFFLCHYE